MAQVQFRLTIEKVHLVADLQFLDTVIVTGKRPRDDCNIFLRYAVDAENVISPRSKSGLFFCTAQGYGYGCMGYHLLTSSRNASSGVQREVSLFGL